MTIHLPEDLESSLRDLVGRGRFASIDEAIGEAARLLLRQQAGPQPTNPPDKDAFHRHLIEIGLMSELPNTAADYDDPDDVPVAIEGEPLSETIIRESR